MGEFVVGEEVVRRLCERRRFQIIDMDTARYPVSHGVVRGVEDTAPHLILNPKYLGVFRCVYRKLGIY